VEVIVGWFILLAALSFWTIQQTDQWFLDLQKMPSNFNTLRTGLLNCLNARSRGLTFRRRASGI